MNRTTQSKWIAALCIAAMAGCASDRMSGDTASNGGSSGSSGMTGSGSSSSTNPSGSTSSTSPSGSSSTAATGSSGSSSSMGTGSSGGTAGATSGSSAQTTYGVVAAIDQMQRQDVGVGAVGAAAVGGSTAMPSDRVYRVTVRMNDGSSQMVVVDSAPSYQIGDRVRYDGSSGTLISY